MNNAVFNFEIPANEPVLAYREGSEERMGLETELARQAGEQIEIPLIIDGHEVRTGRLGKVVMPHEHGHVLATYHQAGPREVAHAIAAAGRAKERWMTLSWVERAAITLKAAELLARKHRFAINAATMLGQGKNAYQAEIDAACETVDFLRYNAYFVSQIYRDQPRSQVDQLNRVEYRPLEGFVFTVSPFNFTAIASNLNMSVALMGNTVVWKPASASILSSYLLMKVFAEAGLPPGVVNFLPGPGAEIGNAAIADRDLAGIHFTGSNDTFNAMWRNVAAGLERYRSYPKLVGETGGKDFIFVHASAEPQEVSVALLRGAFEYQGQKCSACSRAYVPQSLWPAVRERLTGMLAEVRMGDPRDFDNFIGAVIDERSFDNVMKYIDCAKASPDVDVVAGGVGDKRRGYFIAPTVLLARDPSFVTMREEIFGPVLTIYVYEDADYLETLRLCDRTSPYALTGSIFSRDRLAAVQACQVLRFAAGNFYYNDKCTGAMVGLQPFGGARASGTNDKAGGPLNLLRWTSLRTIKETFLPATDFRYTCMSR
ncbi:MAG: L-glutamate gamma-semialdehyde dehydrogenase [Candidatus Krumholzibacteria bacterium]|jgi:1-pyrroline-5-carboxylate dehydrogenase|nr:L-glutamate gamma-semialdehyde dehydrogenase [Candidatus Krumholzibacteria bacterium]